VFSSAGQDGATDYSKAFLVDVRTPGEFAEGSVPGAVNIPLNEVEARVKEFQGKGQVVVFCRSGSRSGQAKSILDANGVANVVNGGTWQQVKNQIKAK
jgi:phage shock protein E